MARTPAHRYADPLDRIWLTTAARVGLRVVRTGDAYASTTGDGTLLLASDEHLDPDDCLAQMIFHEICHWLIQGEEAYGERDWGLDNETDRDTHREHACLRLQATLAGPHGLRQLLGPTTDYRAFYDALPDDPLEPRWEPSVTLAVLARRRADGPPWSPHLGDALVATRAVAEQAARYAEHAPDPSGLADLWSEVAPPAAPHPTGLPAAAPRPGRTCGSCAWRVARTGRCRQAGGTRVDAATTACARWEGALDCQECGACCRAAYGCVQVGRRDPVRRLHPELVVQRGAFLEVLREGDRCAALAGGEVTTAADAPPRIVPYSCRIYDDRPRTCRDFENGGEHCLTARRRVGLSL